MSFDEFYKKYRKHDGEYPSHIPLEWDGYEMRYKNGDIYRYEMELRHEKGPTSVGERYRLDDFYHRAFWNNERIEMKKGAAV